MDEANPKISIEYSHNAIVTTINCERILEDVDIQALEDSFLPLIQEQQNFNIIIDFGKVKFLSSAMLGLLIRLSKEIEDRQGQLRLSSISEKLQGIFRITRLDKVFKICKDKDEALASFE